MKKRANNDLQTGRVVASKQDQLVRLLRRKAGAKTEVLMSKLGWQQHTVRAAISRLRKQGHIIQSKRGTGASGSNYSIVCQTSTDPQALSSKPI